ncbi:hypothetical protein AC623_01725 [Bacillus sp. FJAT-27231]|uniref:hypothetical protein n=1 Tax=Bacillus sp. FJAT-27231 TaxID=1679168 RepID=UPI0006712456|nr:hypothetical protein [Bacillus sp. FJAT-27231]KMY52857.1 hypothetical protein AC623_01725 [Bacillus sp. FJAT-27231]
MRKIKELSITGFKLLPSAKPVLFHGSTVRKTVTDHLWRKKLRPVILEQQGTKCSICEWIPESNEEIRHLHLHEVEKYDFINKICQLIDIQLICRKCHSFQHIIRTQLVSTEEQWKDLMEHFISVNGCSSDIINIFDLIIAKALQLESFNETGLALLSLKERKELERQPVRFTIDPHIPFADELQKQIEKKGLLYNIEH